MRRVGNQLPLYIKQRTGKVEAFFDVYRVRRVGKRGAHLLSDIHEQIVKHFKHDRISVGANG